MANITTEIRREPHDGERHNKQHCCRGDDPWRAAAATPCLPQGNPADESSKLHHSKSDQRRVLMNTYVVDRDVGPLPYLVVGGHAAHVDGKRENRDDEEHFQPHVLQVFVTTDECQEQQAQRDHRTEGGHVIHYQMQMREVHGTRYASRRPAVTAPVQARIEAMARKRRLPLTSLSASLRSTYDLDGANVATLAMMRTILTRNGIAVPHLVAFLINSMTPVTTFTSRPIVITGKTQR